MKLLIVDRSLLLAGATDETIARQLGVSTRTIERRIRELMHAAGAKTRVQLGWYAHINDWVRSENDGFGVENDSLSA